MTTLAEEFLADLGSSDEEEEEVVEEKTADDNGDSAQMDVDGEEGNEPEVFVFDSVDTIVKILHSEHLKEHLTQIDKFMAVEKSRVAMIGLVEDDEEYQLIVESNKIVMKIGDEIAVIHKFIRDHYSPKFPELEQLVPNPLDYARVVKRIGNETDLANVNLKDVLPAASVMVVTLTASTTSGQPLAEAELSEVIKACDAALELEAARQKILTYVESRMTFLAPNLSAIVGTAIAAKLIGIAGGLTALSRLPACNVQVLGSSRKTLQGFSTATTIKHVGFINECDIVRSTPPSLRTKACRLVSTKCTLAARADCHVNPGAENADAIGKKMRLEIGKRIEKLQEPQQAKLAKPLPAPDDKPSKKRGGRRHRKMKERYAMTEMRKTANRIAFGEAQEEVGNELLELGMLGKARKVRVVSDKRVSKKLAQERSRLGTASVHTGGSGLATSLAFTPVQGFDLENPAALKRVEEANKKYFSSTGTFTNLKLAKKTEGEVVIPMKQ